MNCCFGIEDGDSPTPVMPRTGLDIANETLASLLDANRRYANDEALADPHPPSSLELRKTLATRGQAPVATIIACADSRVPPELLFRGTVGSLFVLRTAGNVTEDEAVLASVEYAVAVLKTPLVLVMGHEMCGAVKAAITYKKDSKYGEALPVHLCSHVRKMARSVDLEAVGGLPDDELTTAVVETHAKSAAETLPEVSKVVRDAVKSKDIKVVSAVYDISSGLVRVL